MDDDLGELGRGEAFGQIGGNEDAGAEESEDAGAGYVVRGAEGDFVSIALEEGFEIRREG